MLYNIIEVKSKCNMKKVSIVLLVIIAIIALIIALIFNLKRKNINVQNKNDTIIVNGVVKSKHKPNINMIPVYTENTKQAMQDIYHSEEKVCYLTFDDGPSKSVTPLILDLLKQEDIKATFFVLGSRAELNPETIRREYTEGHYIANHGYSHIYGNIYSSIDAILEEYNRARDIISNILGNGYDGHLFRFPGGSTAGKYKTIKSDSKSVLNENNISYIDWNSLSGDAAGAKTKEAIIENTKKSVGNKNVVVILMHDAGDKILTYEALPEIIRYLREQGYVFKNFYNIMK